MCTRVHAWLTLVVFGSSSHSDVTRSRPKEYSTVMTCCTNTIYMLVTQHPQGIESGQNKQGSALLLLTGQGRWMDEQKKRRSIKHEMKTRPKQELHERIDRHADAKGSARRLGETGIKLRIPPRLCPRRGPLSSTHCFHRLSVPVSFLTTLGFSNRSTGDF